MFQREFWNPRWWLYEFWLRREAFRRRAWRCVLLGHTPREIWCRRCGDLVL